MFTVMHSSCELQLPVRRLPVQSPESPWAAQLEVDCPRAKVSVLLQRCAFCKHGRGLLADEVSHELVLRCSFGEPKSNATASR